MSKCFIDYYIISPDNPDFIKKFKNRYMAERFLDKKSKEGSDDYYQIIEEGEENTQHKMSLFRKWGAQ